MDYKFAERMEGVKPSAIRELFKLGVGRDLISFGGGYPDPDVFPVEQLCAVLDHVLRTQGRQALQYGTSEGIPELREKIAARMARAGVNCAPDEILMTTGGQQGLSLMAKLMIDKRDRIITESPTYLGALIAFNVYQPRYACVPMDGEGMRMDALEATLQAHPDAKFIYTIPEFQNPMGVSMPLERRKKLYELAQKYDVMVLEDSPYREIRFEGEAQPAIKSFDADGRVVHLGSFSKILSPGMRLGWVVASPLVARKMSLLKTAEDSQSSTLMVYAANAFMDMYDLDAHIQKIRSLYKKKKNLMLERMAAEFPSSASWTNPAGGLFTWLTVDASIDTEQLMRQRTLPEANVGYVPGATFFPLEQEHNHARMNYSCMSREKIIEGIARLGAILRSC